MRIKDAVGRFGEDLAAAALQDAGLEILQRNWRSHAGEIDIIARDGAVMVFVEVKTRSTLAYGHPAEAMTAAKIARIHRLAGEWVRRWRAADPERGWVELRFDVVSVVRLGPDGPIIEHLRGAF